jgi:hypothetical protein
MWRMHFSQWISDRGTTRLGELGHVWFGVSKHFRRELQVFARRKRTLALLGSTGALPVVGIYIVLLQFVAKHLHLLSQSRMESKHGSRVYLRAT